MLRFRLRKTKLCRKVMETMIDFEGLLLFGLYCFFMAAAVACVVGTVVVVYFVLRLLFNFPQVEWFGRAKGERR